MPDHASNHPSELERVAAPSWPALDVRCAECHGEGEVPAFTVGDRLYHEPCCHCEGVGRIPTEFGEAVLTFVMSRLRVTTEVRR